MKRKRLLSSFRQSMLLMIILPSLFLCSIKTIAQEKTLIFPIPQEMQLTGDALLWTKKCQSLFLRTRVKKICFLPVF